MRCQQTIPGCRIGWDARMTSTWSWLPGRARKLSPMRTAPKQKPNAVDRARTTVQPHLLSQMATDKHNSFESYGYGSAHNISADLSDQPCPAFLVLWTRATFSCRAYIKTIPTHPTKPRACACWLEVGHGPPQAFNKRAYGGCCCRHVHLMHPY